jgi:hypothetical protein
VTQTSRYTAALERRQAATPKPLNSLPLQPAALSSACLCYASKSRSTKNKTITTTITKRVTATKVQVGLLSFAQCRCMDEQTTTRTFTTRATTTTTELEVQGIYTYVRIPISLRLKLMLIHQVIEHPDSTLTITVTTCSGRNPTPSFDLQVVDTTPTRADSHNLLYPTPSPAPSVGPEFYVHDFLKNAPAGDIFNIDCLGRGHT